MFRNLSRWFLVAAVVVSVACNKSKDGQITSVNAKDMRFRCIDAVLGTPVTSGYVELDPERDVRVTFGCGQNGYTEIQSVNWDEKNIERVFLRGRVTLPDCPVSPCYNSQYEPFADFVDVRVIDDPREGDYYFGDVRFVKK